MNLTSILTKTQIHIEQWLVGPLEPQVRHDMYVDMRAACTHSVMATIINFIPIILRRTGATTDQIAFYYAVTALGLLTTGLSMWLMRHYGMKRVALIFWVIARGSFLLTAFASNSITLLLIFTIFWILEPWPSPVYIKTVEAIYPAQQRGRIMAFVRVALVALTFILTPLAGLVLDRWGYRALLPLAGLSGLGSSLTFFTLTRRIDDTLAATTHPEASARLILRSDQRMPLFLAGMLLFGLGALIAAPLFSVVQVDRLNLSYSQVGWLGLAQSLFWFLGYLFGGKILDRIGGIRALQIVFMINAIVALPYVWAGNGWMLLPSFIAAGLVAAGADLAVMNSVIHLAGPERVSSYWALTSIVSGLRGLLGPFIGSALIGLGWSYSAVFILSAGLTVAGALTLGLIKINAQTMPIWPLQKTIQQERDT